MKFPITFDRRVGGSGAVPLLGSDQDPNTSFPDGPSEVNTGNYIGTRAQGMAGDIGQCLMVGYKTAIGSPVTLPIEVYAWENATQYWYKVATGTLTAGTITLLGPIPSPISAAPTNLNDQTNVVGKLDLYVKIADNTSPDGEMTFGLALSQVGLQSLGT